MKKSRYQLCRGDGGGYWNVVDCQNVHDPRNGQIVGTSHRNKTAALNALRELRRIERAQELKKDLHQ